MIDGSIEPPPTAYLVPAQGGGTREPDMTPKQERSRANREALLNAFADLLAERPYADISTFDVATRAGMTTGAVYSRFRDKQGMALALHERFATRARQTMLDWGARPHWATASAHEIINNWTRGAINFGRMYRPLLTLMMNDPLVQEQYHELMDLPPRILGQLLRTATPDAPENFEGDVEWAARAALVVLERFDLDDDELYDRIETMLHRLIGLR